MTEITQHPDYETVEYHIVYAQLIQAAERRGTVTYQELARRLDMRTTGSPMGVRTGQILGAISQNEVEHNRPMLSAIAVSVEGMPGDSFFDLARVLNVLESKDTVAERKFWEEQKRQIYRIWQQKFIRK